MLDWTGGQNPAQDQQSSYATTTTTTADPVTQSYPQYKDTSGYYNTSQNYSGYTTANQYPPGGGGQANYDSYQNADYNYNNSYYGSGYDGYYGYMNNLQEQGASSTGWDSYGQSNYTGQQDAKTQSASNANNNQHPQQKLPPQRDPRLEKRGGGGQAAGAGRGRDSFPPQVNNRSQPEKPGDEQGRRTFNEMGSSRGGRGGQGSNRGAYSGSYRGDSFEYGKQYEDSSYKRGPPPPQMPPVNNNFDGPPDRRGYSDNRGSANDQMYPHVEEAYGPYHHMDKGWNRNEHWNRGWPDSNRDPRGGDQGIERGGMRGRGDRGGGPRRRGGMDRGGMSGRGRYRDDGGSLHNQPPPHFRGGSSHRGRGRGGPNLTHNDNRVDRNQRSFTYKNDSVKDIQSDNKAMSTNRNDAKDIKQAEKHKVEMKSETNEQPPVKKPCKVEHKVGVKSTSSPPAIKAEMGTEVFPKVEHNTVVTESLSTEKLEQPEDAAAILPDSTSKDTITGPSPAKKRRSTDDLPVDPDVEKALEEMTSPLFCKLCNLTINHPSQAQSHYNGKHHAKKVRLYRQSAALEATLAKKAAQGDLVTTANLVTEVNPVTEPADDKPKEEEEENKAMSEVRL